MTNEELQKEIYKASIRDDEDVVKELRIEYMRRTGLESYICEKCGSTDYGIQNFNAHGYWGAVLDAPTLRYICVQCKVCAYTELYRYYLSSAVPLEGVLYE